MSSHSPAAPDWTARSDSPAASHWRQNPICPSASISLRRLRPASTELNHHQPSPTSLQHPTSPNPSPNHAKVTHLTHPPQHMHQPGINHPSPLPLSLHINPQHRRKPYCLRTLLVLPHRQRVDLIADEVDLIALAETHECEESGARVAPACGSRFSGEEGIRERGALRRRRRRKGREEGSC